MFLKTGLWSLLAVYSCAAFSQSLTERTHWMAEQVGPTVVLSPSMNDEPTRKRVRPDHKNAVPMPLPISPQYDKSQAMKDLRATTDEKSEPVSNSTNFVIPKVSAASRGTGRTTREILDKSKSVPANVSFQLGTSGRPFTTVRADLEARTQKPVATNEMYPYRASGKIFFKSAGGAYICSGSLVKAGIVATAAHCVADFGKQKYFSDWEFVPGYREGVAPFGVWIAQKAYLLDTYFNGTDKCSQQGVVCESDVAVLVLNSKKGGDGKEYFAGHSAGWYSYPETNLFGFTSTGVTHVTQIGYPACLDGGERMQRTDSYAVISKEFAGNTIIGSLMCGGSSGGGWFLNFGVRPELTSTANGTFAEPNVLVGITSWGSSDDGVKHQGSSPVRLSNLVQLVNQACQKHPAACQ